MPLRDKDGKTPGQRAYETFYAYHLPNTRAVPWESHTDEYRHAWEEAAFSVVHPAFDQTGHQMAQHIKIIRIGFGRPAVMYIDGTMFPFYTSEGYAVRPNRNELPTVHFAVVAEKIEVIDVAGLTPARPRKEADGQQNADHPEHDGEARGDERGEQEGRVGGDPGGAPAV